MEELRGFFKHWNAIIAAFSETPAAMKIITLNANGIRAAQKKGLFEWFESTQADVLCIQETKAQLS